MSEQSFRDIGHKVLDSFIQFDLPKVVCTVLNIDKHGNERSDK